MKKIARSAKPEHSPHLNHLFTVGVLLSRSQWRGSRASRTEATHELLRYRDEGLSRQRTPKEITVAKKSRTAKPEEKVFSGQGIIFAVVDDRENMRAGQPTTIDVIADAIEAALDAGFETSEEIARYITTSAFQHVTDKRVRFNSVLKAGDVVGAQIVRKLYNSYNELSVLAEEAEGSDKATLKAEATGFAEAIQVVISPFSSEDPKDPRVVDWAEVERMTEAFEKEQRFVRKERKGNLQ